MDEITTGDVIRFRPRSFTRRVTIRVTSVERRRDGSIFGYFGQRAAVDTRNDGEMVISTRGQDHIYTVTADTDIEVLREGS